MNMKVHIQLKSQSLHSSFDFIKQLLQYHRKAMANIAGNVVYHLNHIEEGLNFLIPSQWWNEFLNQNVNTLSCGEIVIPSPHPLDILIEIGIIKADHVAHQKYLISLEENAQKIAQRVTTQVNQLLREEEEKSKEKPEYLAASSWGFDQKKRMGKYNYVMLCPEVQMSVIKDILIDTFEWKVVTPSLYKLICQNQCTKSSNYYKNQVIGIPIFLNEFDVADYRTEMTYTLDSQISACIYYRNQRGETYAVVGAIENKMTVGKIIKYVNQGMNKMAIEEDFTPTSYRNNSVISYRNLLFAGGEGEREKLLQLKYLPYEKIAGDIPLNSLQLIQLNLKLGTSSSKNHQEDEDLFKNCRPSKKCKQNESQRASFIEKTIKKKGFHPPAPQNNTFDYQEFSGPIQLAQGNDSIYISHMAKNIQTNTENHSSTEQQTPSVIILESMQNQNDQLRLQRRDQTRIHYPLWKKSENVQALLKLGEIKMNDSISIPLSNTKRIIAKTKSHKRVFLSGKCNKLIQNSMGEIVEEESPQEMPDVMSIPKQIIISLQQMAFQIMGNKKEMSLDLQVNKEDILDPAKQKLDMESQTCKNEDLDELDEVESRQC